MTQLQQWLNPRSSAAKMAVLFVVVSVVFYATRQWTMSVLPLSPELVLHEYRVWQVLTYACLFGPQPLSFIFGVLILVSIGGNLERHWGAKRLWVFAFATTGIAGLLTSLLAFVIPGLNAATFTGADVVTGTLWVAFGLLIGNGRTNFWGAAISGNALAAIGFAFVLLNGLLASSWLIVVPELIALALTFLHVKYGVPDQLWVRFNSWRLHRDLSRRSSHLRVITGDQRNTPRDSDKYLH